VFVGPFLETPIEQDIYKKLKKRIEKRVILKPKINNAENIPQKIIYGFHIR